MRHLSSENEARVESMTSQLMTSEKELAAMKDQLRQAEKQHQQQETKWKTDTDRLQVCHVNHVDYCNNYNNNNSIETF